MIRTTKLKKNTLIVTGTVTTSNSSPFTKVSNSLASYSIDEHKDHFIKIIEGTGLNAVSWICSNTINEIILQTGIQVDADAKYEIYKSEDIEVEYTIPD